MNKQIQNYPPPQQDILHAINRAIKHYPEYRYYVIQRKRPSFTPRDMLTSEALEKWVWIDGYAKSAKALVQRGVLIQEGYCCYSLTQYGKELLGMEAQS